jgi:hypothetical protein
MTARHLLAGATAAAGVAAVALAVVLAVLEAIEQALWSWSEEAPDFVPAEMVGDR